SARAAQFVQNRLEAIERPVEIRARDDEGRSQPHHGLVRLLRQHALFQQTLAGLARAREGRTDLGAGPQPAAAHLLEGRARHRVQALEHVRAEDGLFSTRPSSRIILSASSPTAAASGLPPNVEPCEPGVKTSVTSRRATKADTGSTPPPSALPRITPSGRIPSCSKANQAPVRPRPDCTSSRMSSTRCA